MIYDPFQEEAIKYIKEGHSVIVSAPTGAGKTVIAEYVINDCLEKGVKAVYTAPIKALSNQKFREFQEKFPEKIGILTGDVSINPEAPILIMTTEIFRNKVLEERTGLDEYAWIIFDEIHYIDDYERGTVWEESLIFLPKHMKLLALSATIPNIGDFSEWIHSIHKKPLKIVKENKRPVPLHFFYQCQGEILDNLNKVRRLEAGIKKFYTYKGRSYYKKEHIKPNRPTSLISHLFKNERLPCIYFSFGRRRCEYLAEEMQGFDFLAAEEKEKIRNLYHALCEKYDLSNEKSALRLFPLIERGIAYHHAGMLPTLKEAVERLFTSRLIKVIFTTETFALGINMPARTVIFDELRKFYGRFHQNLRTRDFYQMAGRAGRRGIDKEGFVYSRVNPHFISFNELKRVIYSEPELVRSRFNVSYATILNLYAKYGEKLYDIYPLSFHYFREKEKLKQRALALIRARVEMLKKLGCIKDEKLTEKGVFAGRIYGYELSLSELYDANVLEYLSDKEMAILALALVFEPRKGFLKPNLSKTSRKLQNITDGIVARVNKLEKKMGIEPLSKAYMYHLSPVIEAWMEGEEFSKILRYGNSDEGEVIRYFRMAIQILREILDTPVSPEVRMKIKNALNVINRDIIDAEKQLRM
ncbi:MAG: DEAD/DEAH box helicase [Candidatus Omnitrophica bacterium]|nr:DEAD/DEAH box helicase [Candidatus Omnitrophota bacterium]